MIELSQLNNLKEQQNKQILREVATRLDREARGVVTGTGIFHDLKHG